MRALPWLLVLFLITTSATETSTIMKLQRLAVLRQGSNKRNPCGQPSSAPVDDIPAFFYNQTLDHFHHLPESYATFRQRNVVNFKYWGGARAAARFGALLVYIEHCYYRESLPLGSREEAMKNAITLGYFNSAQALVDYAEVIINLKAKISAGISAVIVVGASYGGILASWFHLKYLYITLGALASSARVLYFDDVKLQDGYFSIVTKDFKEVSKSCYKTIKQSWSEIDKVAAKANGLSVLSKKFKTCRPLKDASRLKDYLRHHMYSAAAQCNRRPAYPFHDICFGIDGASKGTNILGWVFSGIVTCEGEFPFYELELKEPNRK
ncbi:hypothetical protein L1049_022947 [Liquidambar formosana]|uniref:Uncharacterized protein n=1 Tax=Liquidambar formosana TaxID=63359 RepID=A0AAP0WSG2_LIQFO